MRALPPSSRSFRPTGRVERSLVHPGRPPRGPGEEVHEAVELGGIRPRLHGHHHTPHGAEHPAEERSAMGSTRKIMLAVAAGTTLALMPVTSASAHVHLINPLRCTPA